jgi:hypothetical protein
MMMTTSQAASAINRSVPKYTIATINKYLKTKWREIGLVSPKLVREQWIFESDEVDSLIEHLRSQQDMISPYRLSRMIGVSLAVVRSAARRLEIDTSGGGICGADARKVTDALDTSKKMSREDLIDLFGVTSNILSYAMRQTGIVGQPIGIRKWYTEVQIAKLERWFENR